MLRSMLRPRCDYDAIARSPADSTSRDRLIQLLKQGYFDAADAQHGPMCRRRFLLVVITRERKRFRQNGQRIHVSMAW
jgi:hypothetical protein